MNERTISQPDSQASKQAARRRTTTTFVPKRKERSKQYIVLKLVNKVLVAYNNHNKQRSKQDQVGILTDRQTRTQRFIFQILVAWYLPI